MLSIVSHFREVLTRRPDASLHRCIYVLAGENIWQRNILQEIASGYEEEILWVGENVPENFPFVSIKKAHSWLGREKQLVVFDANDQFNVDAFAAISGIVVGGGLFILLMPAVEQWEMIYSSPFGYRLINSVNSTSEIVIIKQDDKQINFPLNFTQAALKQSSSPNVPEPYLTLEQQNVVEVIEKAVRDKSNLPVVITSDRGRGKSAALGIAAARLIKNGIKNIVITAPRLRATEIIFKHIEALLPDAEVSRGKVQYKDCIIQFYSPDQLIEKNINTDLLFIDEAAAIPVPLLTIFLNKYKHCAFASTVHGYEGTGRGFALRFNKVLNEKKPGWKKCLMKTPVRWGENDPLEKWMFSLLCLDAEIVDSSSIGKIDLDKLEITHLSHSQIAKDAILLNEIFALLVLAHYRTQPSDLQRLLDDENLTLYIVKYKQHILSVALASHEGGFSNSLSTQVYRGERRPPGHLLAQALTYHCGVEHAAILKYARIMRIAVHPEFQQQGIGSKLIDFIVDNEKRTGCDAIGTSFGMNKPLLQFWKRASFDVVRIGFKREQTSGEHAAIMILALSEDGKTVRDEACSRFNGQLSFWFNDVLRDIQPELKKYFSTEESKAANLTQLDTKDLQSFSLYSRNYELCIAALNKLVMIKRDEINRDNFPADFRQVLTSKTTNKTSWKDIGINMSLSGQDEARKLFHRAINYLIDR